MSSELEHKVAILTGAGKGIGLAIAQMLAKEKTHLVLNARTESDLEQVKSHILSHINPNAEVHLMPGSVSNPQTVEHIVQQTIKRFGRIDVLINNAGVCPEFRLLQELSVDDIQNTIDINLKGPIYFMKYAIPQMVQQGAGTIININSIAGKVAFPYSNVYCATKFGLAAITESVLMEQRQNNIKVVGIYPGEVDTSIWETIEPGVPQNPDFMLDPQDIAEAVRYVLIQPSKVLVKDVTLLPARPKNPT